MSRIRTICDVVDWGLCVGCGACASVCDRGAVVLRDIEGLSYDEIAKITGLNLGTVKSKLARARLDLREKLSGVI